MIQKKGSNRSAGMEKILLFIPAYNCEKQIIRVLNQLNAEITAYFKEIIVVNNRSTDDTEKVIKEYIQKHKEKPIHLLRNKENYGLGGSHKVAFQYAIEHEYDYIVVLHGDDQGSISDIVSILKKKIYKKYDCCLGARFMKNSILEGYSKFRTFGNIVYNLLFSAVTRKKIYDLGSGLNLYKVEMLKSQFYFKFPDKLTFNYCMILAAHYYKQQLYFFPISWREEDQVSNVKMLNQATYVLKMLGKYFLNKKYILKEFREQKRQTYEADIL